MIELKSKEDYEKYIKQKTVFVFSADWCPDCRFIEPRLPEIEKEFSKYTFVHVDRDKFIDICALNNVMGIPSFVVYENGVVKGTFISKFRKTKEEIVSFLNNIK